MATKREERERARAERLAAEQREQAAQKRRLILGYVVAGGLTLAVVIGLGIVIASGGGDESGASEDFPSEARIEPLSGVADEAPPDTRAGTEPPPVEQAELGTAAVAAGCELRTDLPDEGNTHFDDEDKNVDYGTDPPTSGDHYGAPTETAQGAIADGAYSEMPPASRLVHSLEHGRVEIQYSPDLSEMDQLAIKGVFDADPFGVILFPNPEMRYAVAATAWTQLLGCDAYEGQATLDAIRAFRDTYRGRGPEAVPIQLSG